MAKLKKGDTIKCHDKTEMISYMKELETIGVRTEFLYQKDGVDGYWLEVVEEEKAPDMRISRAIEVLESINGLDEIADALQMGIRALEMQINLGEMLQEFKDDPKGIQYSETLVMEFLNDVYMLSEVNQ